MLRILNQISFNLTVKIWKFFNEPVLVYQNIFNALTYFICLKGNHALEIQKFILTPLFTF